MNHDTYDRETIARVVNSLRADNKSMICDMLIQTWDRAEAAGAALAAVPVENIYYVWLAAVAHSRDNGNYASEDATAVDVWLAAQQVKPWEVQP